MNAPLILNAAGHQLLGGRERQNDAALWGDTFALVADGAGSHVEAAAVAHAVVQIWADASGLTDLLDAPEKAARALRSRAFSSVCTLAGVTLDPDGLLWVSCIGDSRALVVRTGELLLATTAQDWATYRTTLDPSAHVDAYDRAAPTRVVGPKAAHVPELQVLRARRGDTVVVLSDGVDAVLPQQILDVVAEDRRSVEDLAADVLDLLDPTSIPDNATCVVARVIRSSSEVL